MLSPLRSRIIIVIYTKLNVKWKRKEKRQFNDDDDDDDYFRRKVWHGSRSDRRQTEVNKLNESMTMVNANWMLNKSWAFVEW